MKSIFRKAGIILSGLFVLYIAFIVFYRAKLPLVDKFRDTTCLSCHVQMELGLIDPVAAGFSGGAHPINNSIPGFGEWTSDVQCIECHEATGKEHAGSPHKNAGVDEFFMAAFALEPHAWCLNCHVPQRKNESVPEQLEGMLNLTTGQMKKKLVAAYGDAAGEGVGCRSCHVRSGKIYGAEEVLPVPEEDIHAVIQSDLYQDAGFCKNCHEFQFPAGHTPVTTYHEEFMQKTYSEWSSSKDIHKKENCQSCHFPDASHSLPGPSTKGFLAKHINLEFTGNKALLSVNQLGHRLPTGDLFTTLDWEVYDIKGKRILLKHFGRFVDPASRNQWSDSTIAPNNTKANALELKVPEQAKECRLVYRSQGRFLKFFKKYLPAAKLQTTVYSGNCK